jgi:DNA (cytosine-5)-methyltransferase 1
MAQALGLAIRAALKAKNWDWDWEAMLWPESQKERIFVAAPSLEPGEIDARNLVSNG